LYLLLCVKEEPGGLFYDNSSIDQNNSWSSTTFTKYTGSGYITRWLKDVIQSFQYDYGFGLGRYGIYDSLEKMKLDLKFREVLKDVFGCRWRGNVIGCVANYGDSLQISLKTKNTELRQTALAAAASALIAGTTEPALYGVAVRLKRPLIASCITGFVCGCIAGLAGLASRSMVSPSVITGIQFIDPANPGFSIAAIIGVSALSIILSFILTLLIGFKDIPEGEM
ncbi:MAG: hypothetical protein HUJ63_01800, partial [Enterococcus sp.]|nr:hypothetical protein [Enterococcus sp.]